MARFPHPCPMFTPRQLSIAAAVCAAFAPASRAQEAAGSTAPAAAVAPAVADPAQKVTITSTRERRMSKGATGLDLSLADTPQSLTVYDRATLDAFGLDTVNSLLRLTTGVNVEAAETDRTYYNSRGFDIRSFQVDGVGMPFDGLIAGALDTALYDRVEVVRGANGLLTGTGNPSGTVNYVRKRPTNEFQATGQLTLGSWNRKRLEADVSTPLTESGEWAARAVAVVEDKDSWLDLYKHQTRLFYGVVDGQLGDRSTLTLGYTHQDSLSDGVLWGALPLIYSDGTQASFDESVSTSQRWTYWNVHTDSAFAELAVRLDGGWQLKSELRHDKTREFTELFWTFPSVIDRDSGAGVYGWPGKFDQYKRTTISDTSLSGRFQAFGRPHEATVGLSLARSHTDYFDHDVPTTAADPYYYEMPAFPGWTGNEFARPDFGPAALAGQWDERLYRLYGATRLNLSDPLKLILGFNAVDSKKEGFSFGTPANQSERAVSPYMGLTWRLSDTVNAYASYSDIYQPQSTVNQALQPVGSAKGKSYEAGLKSELLDRRLLASVAVFQAKQDNLEEFVGYTGTDFIAYYEGVSVKARGVELELTGRPTPSLQLHAGWTYVNLEDREGARARTFIPRNSAKLLAQWKVPGVPGLELGASARWQDAVYVDLDAGRVTQGAYGIVGLQAGYQLTPRLKVNATLDNVTDKKHLTSLQWDQAYYGEPRSLNLRLSWSY